jgi:hypothetical protein
MGKIGLREVERRESEGRETRNGSEIKKRGQE